LGKIETPDLVNFLREITKDLDRSFPVRVPRKKALGVLAKMYPGIDTRIIFEEWERNLRKPIVVGNWSVLYSVYSDALVLESLPDWGQIERAIDIRRENLRQELSASVAALPANAFAVFLANLFSRVDWASDVKIGKLSRDGGVDFRGYYIYRDKGKVPMFGQAKHWKAKVGSEPIRTFIGSVVTKAGGKACVGLYACTGGFTFDAEKEIEGSPFKLLRFDLQGLVDIMIESNVGVRRIQLNSPRIDGSFWDEISG
jgi:hypothetical protein